MRTKFKIAFSAMLIAIVSSCHDEAKLAPTVTTGAVTNVTKTSASIAGNVTSDGNDGINERGICWSTNSNPTITDNKNTASTKTTGNFNVDIIGLTANTTYHARAYAANSKGTSYGTDISFTTDDVPGVTTGTASDISQTTATVAGTVTSDGNTTVTDRGICWSVSHNATITDSKVSSGNGTGAFNGNLTGLTGNTTYYARAYATNSQGTSYGSEVTILTLDLPIVVTAGLTNLRSVSTTGGGNVTFDGNTPVTAYGVCWSSTNGTPTTADSNTMMGSGTGTFSGPITGLDPLTTYFFRAFATNSVGTSYGLVVQTTTPDAYYNMIANFKFDGLYNDSQGINSDLNHGSSTTFTTDRNGNANSALLFSGNANSYVASAGALNFNNTSKFTVSFWYNLTPGFQAGFYGGSSPIGAYMIRTANYDVNFYYGGSSASKINFDLTDGTNSNTYWASGVGYFSGWHHVAIVYDGTKQSMYIDGAGGPITPSPSINVVLGMQDFVFGNNYFSNCKCTGSYYYGSLDDLKIFSRDLSDTEVNYIYTH
ncbi:MAG: LamG domain-containing protein [Cyclobacteriaceae bacterium]